ncbi:MAG: uroporphyrinogen decarboxylase family protein [Clostridia bacterium]
MHIFRTSEPDFSDLEKLLRREPLAKPIPFEIFVTHQFFEFFTGEPAPKNEDELETLKWIVNAFYNAGYVHATTWGANFSFPKRNHERKESVSLNDCSSITDRESFESFKWIDPNTCDYSRLEKISPFLPGKMKLLITGPSGVLENVTALVGYDNMCYMLYEDPELLKDIFDKVGSSLYDYYRNCLEYDTVGAIVVNDDWGFNTQTFLSAAHLREYVFPWHKKIVELAHAKGKCAILHSCGNLETVFEDIITDMKFDGKHSFEDKILSVEDSFEKYGNRIAILGGLDIDFFIRATTDEVTQRAEKLVRLTTEKGGYALGTGNSLCSYIPEEKVVALLNVIKNYK